MAKPYIRWKHRSAGPRKCNGAIKPNKISKPKPRKTARARIQLDGFTLADAVRKK